MATPASSVGSASLELDNGVSNLGILIGLLTDSGAFNPGWFSDPVTELSNLPQRVGPLLSLIDLALGPPSAGTPVFENAQWYPIPNPLDGSPTGCYLVIPPPSDSATQAEIGLGISYPFGYDALTIDAYAYIPMFRISTEAAPVFLIGSEPAQFGVRATSTNNFTASNNVEFSALRLDADVYFADQPPTMELVFEQLTRNGGPPSDVSYQTLSALLDDLSNAGDWIASVIAQGTYWLNNYIGSSTYTIGNVLTAACVLNTDADGSYQLNSEYLQTNADNPLLIAQNFLFNALNTLADSTTPILPISTGDAGSGIYIVREATDGGGSDYGLRLLIQGIQAAVSSSGSQITVQLGKWIANETDANSWLARSSGAAAPPPGVSLYLMQSSSTSGNCSNPPSVSFAPHVEFVSLGIDIGTASGQPLFSTAGCALRGAELRVYFAQTGGNVTFGAAASLDGLGVPLGPAFGGAVKESGSNPVARNLLASGSDQQGGDPEPVNPAFSMSLAWVEQGTFAFQLYDSGNQPANEVTIPIQRAFGPLQCDKLGVGWVQDPVTPANDMLSLLFDGTVSLLGLSVDLIGLSVGIPVTTPTDYSAYDLDLQGLGLSLNAGPVELSAGFAKVPADLNAKPPRTYTEYDGEALLKAGTYAIAALGSYAYVPNAGTGSGYASLFIFGILNGEIGGPEFFFITGLAAGFGYNRALILPDQNSVPQFPLVAGANDPSALGGQMQNGAWSMPDPATALAHLDQFVPPQRGEYWLAAGIRFTSFDLINSTMLLTVAFGNELEIALLGLSWMSLPPPALPGASAPTEKYAYLELGIEVKLLPSDGVFSATAVLTPNSFVIDPACKVTGGFAFYVWFGDNPHAGEFVLTIGGYHPAFDVPSYYPTVPRVGFNWPMPGDVSISGEAYFALTPSAIMAGGGLAIVYSKDWLNAWFKAQMDAIVVWAPFHYLVNIEVSIGVSCRVHLLFVTTTLKVELGAQLTVWGPKMGGSVHVNWYVVSFTVGFGAGRTGGSPPLDWSNADGTGFAQTLLPHQTQAVTLMATPAPGDSQAQPGGNHTITVNAGLLGTIASGSQSIWLVRPDTFVFSATTSIPATEVDIAAPEGAPPNTYQPQPGYPVCVRPMKATLASSVLSITVTDEQNAVYDLNSNFDLDLAYSTVPAAKWGAPLSDGQDPEFDSLLAGRLMGIQNATPKAPALTPSGDDALAVDVASSLTFDTVNEESPYSTNYLPLDPAQTPSGSMPQVDAESLTKIQTTLMDVGVAGLRTQIFAALQQYGADPLTNGGLTILATNPAAVLAGDPLILAS